MKIITFFGIVLVAAMASVTSALGAGIPQTDYQEVITVTPDFDTPVFYEEKLIIPAVLYCPGDSMMCYTQMFSVKATIADGDKKKKKTVLV